MDPNSRNTDKISKPPSAQAGFAPIKANAGGRKIAQRLAQADSAPIEAGAGGLEMAQRPRLVMWMGAITIFLVIIAVLYALLRTPPDAQQQQRRAKITPPPTGKSFLETQEVEPLPAKSFIPVPGVEYPKDFKPMQPKPMRSARGTVVTGPDGIGALTPIEPSPTVVQPEQLEIIKTSQDGSIVRKKGPGGANSYVP